MVPPCSACSAAPPSGFEARRRASTGEGGYSLRLSRRPSGGISGIGNSDELAATPATLVDRRRTMYGVCRLMPGDAGRATETRTGTAAGTAAATAKDGVSPLSRPAAAFDTRAGTAEAKPDRTPSFDLDTEDTPSSRGSVEDFFDHMSKSRDSSTESTSPNSLRESNGEKSWQPSEVSSSLTGSLMSFSDSASFGGAGGSPVEVGTLTFVKDEEMADIMATFNNFGNSSASDSDDDDLLASGGAKSGNLTSVLGTGSFSTVRLAWRKTERPRNNPVFGASIPEDQETRFNAFLHPLDEPEPFNDKGDLVAVKILEKSILKRMKTMYKDSNDKLTVRTAFDNIEREIATMKKLCHPNLVRLFEVTDSTESDLMYLVLEFVSLGEIMSYTEGTNRYARKKGGGVKGLTPAGYFTEEYAALYFVDILHGLAHIHKHRICHRDLKPENILLGANGMAKICDFGVSHMFEDKLNNSIRTGGESISSFLSEYDQSDSYDEGDFTKFGETPHLQKGDMAAALAMSARFDRGHLQKSEGTYCFWSPEMCRSDGKSFSGYACDLWAAGVCLYIFTTGQLPFFSTIPTELFDHITNDEVNYDGLGLSETVRNLMETILESDPSKRTGLGRALKHPFCKKAIEQRYSEHYEFEQSAKFVTRVTKQEMHEAFSITMLNADMDLSASLTMGRYSAMGMGTLCEDSGWDLSSEQPFHFTDKASEEDKLSDDSGKEGEADNAFLPPDRRLSAVTAIEGEKSDEGAGAVGATAETTAATWSGSEAETLHGVGLACGGRSREAAGEKIESFRKDGNNVGSGDGDCGTTVVPSSSSTRRRLVEMVCCMCRRRKHDDGSLH